MISYLPGLKGFGMDPVGTLPDIVNNSLIYAWDGTIDLLTALPKAWPKGSISGVGEGCLTHRRINHLDFNTKFLIAEPWSFSAILANVCCKNICILGIIVIQ